MKQNFKRVISLTLVVSMLLSIVPYQYVFADETTYETGSSEISFSASRYEVSEGEGTYDITVKRSGANDHSVKVAYKAADFLATYGEDYVIFDEDGNELPLSDGIAPTPEDLKPTEEVIADTNTTQSAITAEGVTESAITAEDIQTEVADEEETLVEEQTTEAEEVIEEETTSAQTEDKSFTDTGSSLMNAQAAYLNLPQKSEDAIKSVEGILDNFHEYFESARGAMGFLTFAPGETQKKITVKIIDNDKAQADKIILLALMGIGGDENTTLSANPTAYINILDDEEYETPVIEAETTKVRLNKENDSYELKLYRTSGVDYYTAVTVSTVKETAAEGVDYDKMDAVKVSFVPGETEKSIVLSGKNFDEDKTYGIRIESDGTCEVEDDYIRVYLSTQALLKSSRMMLRSSALTATQSTSQTQTMLGASNAQAIKGNGYVVGSEKTTKTLDQLGLVNGPKCGSGDGWNKKAWDSGNGWNNYGLYESNRNDGRSWRTNTYVDFYGINTATIPHMNCGEHSGSWGNYHLWVDTVDTRDDVNNYNTDSLNYFSYKDNHSWVYSNLDVKNTGIAYMRFGVRNDGTAKDNIEAWFGNPVTFTWDKVNFVVNANNNPGQYFERFKYDFTKEGEVISKTPYDNTTSYIYNPGAAYFVDSNNNKVTGFYANYNQIIKPVSVNEAANAAEGIELEGVYLYTKKDSELYNKNIYAPYEDTWTTDNTLWVPASGVRVDQHFYYLLCHELGVKNLGDIKVMPKYKQKSVTLKVYTADNGETYVANMNYPTGVVDGDWYYIKNKDSGLYLSTTSTKYASNVVQSEKNGSLSMWRVKENYSNSLRTFESKSGYMLHVESADYKSNAEARANNGDANDGSNQQSFTFNNGRVGTTERYIQKSVYNKYKRKTIDYYLSSFDSKESGANVAMREGRGNSETWIFEPVDAKYAICEVPCDSLVKMKAITAKEKVLTGFNIVDQTGTTGKMDDANPSVLEIAVKCDTTVYPKTEEQGMNVAYMPSANNKPSDLTNRVYQMPTVVDKNTTTESTDKDGNLNIATVYTGMPWMFGVATPDGMVTKWTNGTGDVKNVNGRIDVSDDPTINEENQNTMYGLKNSLYDPIYGNVIAGTIVQNNTKYYYEFVQKNSSDTLTVFGRVRKKDGTFKDIVENKELPIVPVSNATINIAGTNGSTDKSGYFEMDLKGIENSGRVTVKITDPETKTDYVTTATSNYLSVIMPAYECFKPKDLSVYYAGKDHTIDDNLVRVFDDTLTVNATVDTNGQMIATNAKFYIVKTNGTTIDCSTDDRFETKFYETMGKATLKFNPSSIMDSGDKLYVSFIDQSDNEYKRLDIGYSFIKPVSIKEFAFPLIGSTWLEDTYNSAYELIGDPLGSVSLGKLTLPDPNVKEILPPGITDEAYKYTQADYIFGDFSTAIKTFKSEEDKKDEKKEEGKDEKDKSKETSDEVKKATKDNGKETEDGGYKTEGSFTWEVNVKAAFSLTLTSRKDADGQYRNYFEELDFLAGVDFKVESSTKISLPIGMNVIVTGNLSGDVTAIFQLKTNYQRDPTWSNNKVEYSAGSFGLFEEIPNVNRYLYIMLNPKISIGLDIEYAIVTVGGSATFDFDMDFKLGLDKGNFTKYLYGDMTYSFNYHVKVLSFDVYSKDTDPETVKLFSQNANGHIEPDIMSGIFGPCAGSELSTELLSRAYLKNSVENSLMLSIDVTDGTTETSLKTGMYPDAKYKTIATGNNTALMVYIDDVQDRNAANRTALYYRTYDGTTWSEPQRVDATDETLDDYPEAFDLGDKVMVAWSSASKEITDDMTVQEALSTLDIKVAMFDKATQTFDSKSIKTITHDTKEDYTADVMPRIAYDTLASSTSGTAILYYTKTEYKNAEGLDDLLGNTTWSEDDKKGSPSVIAYRFYDTKTGEWNGADYTDEELNEVVDSINNALVKENKQVLTEAEAAQAKEDYKVNWYGQRFLDTRLDKSSGTMLRIVDTDCISYNGLSLYAWTVDYDRNLETVDDRDVFMQIYNFDEKSFTHVIRVTATAGNYGTPHFGRYNDNTYLFFSAVGDLGNGEDANTSGIAYINVTEPIKNDKFTLIEENNTQYYKLQYMNKTEEHVSDEAVIPSSYETVTIKPSYAVKLNGYVNNFSVDVDKNERMYLTWSDTPEGKEGERQIFTSIFDTKYDEKHDTAKNDDYVSINGEWSEPFEITSEANAGYTNVDTVVLNDKLYIVANKASFISSGNGQVAVLDEDNSNSVVLEHTPFAKLVSPEENALVADTKYIYPNKEFTLTSTVRNDGVKMIDEPVTVKFTMTANDVTTDLGTVAYNETIDGKTEGKVTTSIGGGKTATANIVVPALEEISNDLTFNAVVSMGGTVVATQELKAVKEVSITTDGSVDIDKINGGITEIGLSLTNEGNIDSEDMTIDVYKVVDNTRDKKISSFIVPAIQVNSTVEAGGILEAEDEDYTIDENGIGTIDLEVVVSDSTNKELYSFTATDGKQFDTDAINVLNKVSGASVRSTKVAAKPDAEIEINPQISGSFNQGEVRVMWVSDNTDVVTVNNAGKIFAENEGTAKLTGYVVPTVDEVVFNADATEERYGLPNDIPSQLVKTVEVNVTVGDVESSDDDDDDDRSSGSGSGSSSASTGYDVTFDTNGGDAVGEISVDKNGKLENLPTPVKEGYTFEGWYTDEALTQEVTADTVATSDLKLYAKWTESEVQPDADGYVNKFKDVSKTSWFYDAVKYVCTNNLFKGIADDEFAPNKELTRAMLVTILYRAEGEPEVTGDSEFDDVKSGSYYTDAVAWAKENEVVKGITDEKFAPNDNITREQAAAIIYRYAKTKNAVPENLLDNELGYADISDISDWAKEAVLYCKVKGIMQGKGNNEFKPSENATRAETAAIIQRFMESMESAESSESIDQ